MFIEFVSAHASAIVTAVMLVPVLVFSIALFLEGARKIRWPSVPSVHKRPHAAPAPRRQPVRRQTVQGHGAGAGPVSVTGGAGLRHGIAARRDHD